ncbi:hypothetical protein [Nocardioides flavescens]|uniref:Uncharacterized protein n=1 Tax=Nocardioides flavescens TaxID=2691959 RepID=A0A6L7EV75_9ACTN|nr:hypothetical protein [Nocardioides flavescens]MXG90610.1 hypothetical protein [Nocardioides flavescens]
MTSRVRTTVLSPLLSPLLVGAVLGVGLGAAGCGDRDAPAGTSADVSTSSDPTPPPTLPTLAPPTAPPSSPSDGFTKVRLSGVVSVEPAGVLLTDTNGVKWLLVGVDLEPGTQVTVTGTAVKGSDPGPGEPVPLQVTDLSVAD